jgi:spore germination cell wall hydrolase CwlJ-like protein
VKKTARKQGPARSRGFEDYVIHSERSALREYGPMAFGGVMLVMAFAFAGHYMGQNAVAHNAEPDTTLEAIVAPTSNIIAKGSLMPDGNGLEIVNMTVANKLAVQPNTLTVTKTEIAALPEPDQVETAAPAAASKVQVIPASVDLKEATGNATKKKLALAPPVAKVEKAFKLKRSEKQKVVAQRRVALAEENCLARAVYFEARSESELGQLAVAKVILNRVKDPEYPKSICGVVYQGSGRRNSCQFSFACDGLPDDVKSASAWANSKRIAQKALGGDAKVAAIGSATNYHADYVRPKWAKTMKRLIKIGHHVFYEDS